MEHAEITEKIIGCAYRVFNVLGSGFLESVYEKAMIVELMEVGMKFDSQVQLKVYYKGTEVGHFIADLVVEEVVVVELKAIRSLELVHEVQLVNYLNGLQKPVGLLINFGDQKVEVRRKVRTLPTQST
jgi:GxxExxY protein